MQEKKIKLRPFQKKVRDLVLEGKNVILQAPTGSGKTHAAKEPHVRNLRQKGTRLPANCIYATPLRTLTTQFYQDSRELITKLDKRYGMDYTRLFEQVGKQAVSIQTGEQPDDPQFEALITYCTIDQLLASFLGIPYGIGRSRANMNVSAVMGSYLILDEFHLYPLLLEGESCYGARTTTLAMLSLLKGITPFVLMTATFSTSLLTQLAELLGATIVQVTEEDLALIEEGRQRFFTVSETSMSAEAILAQHQQCSLVICNTVVRAQQRYWELRDLARARGIEIVLLHSRLTDEDRAQRSRCVCEKLGPEHWKQGHYTGTTDIIVVATQVIEVGLDISVQHLHTEIAPANSLIQRAGRCARYAQQRGQVIVYPLPKQEQGRPVSTQPYDAQLCAQTLKELQARDPATPMDCRAEQRLIDAVHTEEDTQLLERFARRREQIQDEIFTSLRDHSTSTISSLIRNVHQVQVLIHNTPEQIKIKPWEYQSFSLHPASLAATLHTMESQRDDLGLTWNCRKAEASKQDLEGEQDSRQLITYTWEPIPYIADRKSYEKALQNALLLMVPNELATYHPELGFLLRDGRLDVPWNTYQSPVRDRSKRKKYEQKPIVQQRYREHIGGLVQAYNQGVAHQITYLATRLEHQLTLPKGSIDQAIRLAIACHDLGKLSIAWQEWAWAWQRALYDHMPSWPTYQQEESFFFAKTDYDSQDPEQRELQRSLTTKRPNHACESLAIGSALLSQSLGVTALDDAYRRLWRATCTAIAHHHTSTASTFNTVQLKPGAMESIQQALDSALHGQTERYNITHIRTQEIPSANLMRMDGSSAYLTVPERGTHKELETWLYFLIVRALRLSDQRADTFHMRYVSSKRIALQEGER